jgi:hypothetical protein
MSVKYSAAANYHTHTAPMVNTAHTATFLPTLIFNPQQALIGTSSMSASLIVLKSPLTCNKVGRSIHCPSSCFFQAFSCGLHCHILTRVRET